jgi:hypothetical protein
MVALARLVKVLTGVMVGLSAEITPAVVAVARGLLVLLVHQQLPVTGVLVLRRLLREVRLLVPVVVGVEFTTLP